MKHRPHVAFFGSSLVSTYWNGAATYYRGLIRALSVLGYRTTFYEPDTRDRLRLHKAQKRALCSPGSSRRRAGSAHHPDVH
ncbi:hypothetical protein [Methylocaldum szegediense]|jgi:spore maturation protein CgeB|uniref:Uncharacterized protein n=1 Tax=Methylocaldum szegediense TaxID=73780 RepID=A0ABN8X2A0_9GAMM|nr:hypothetical protein [Methylocaldum szegediense]CAI8769619.1 protein of unknown function [Methylocaldum szegediense]